jgi:hypothetical protein
VGKELRVRVDGDDRQTPPVAVAQP